MIEEIQLSLAKIFVKNKDSHSIVQVIEQANQIFTKEYFKKVYYSGKESYEELKEKLIDVENESKELACIIKNKLSVRNVHKLIDFSIKSILCIKKVVFNIQVDVIEKYNYEREISKIAKAIEFYSDYQNNK